MSKWGEEELETLNAINKLGFTGDILNIASGDGRFNNRLLELADSVTAIDISEFELTELKNNTKENLRSKLSTKVVDITAGLPFGNSTFDGIFCTGTLHLFNIETIKNILSEIKRILKENGKIVLDFATDIIRLDKNGNKVTFDNEGNYILEEAITFFKSELEGFSINIEISSFKEENLDEEDTAYESISGRFLVISGVKEYELKEF